MAAKGEKVLVFGGKTGLLGQSLTRALSSRGYDTRALSSSDFDVCDEGALADCIDREAPSLVFNAVAYTMVDQAEDEKEKAYILNKTYPTMLGRVCKARGAGLVHYSTDFVFSGEKDTPYKPDDQTGPSSIYGASKLAGEQALMELDLERLWIVRTSWLFGPGKINFVRKILGLAQDRDKLTVVHDQKGSPTYTPDLAEYSIDLVESGVPGIFHIANSGTATWCELASEAVTLAGLDCRIEAVPTSAYPTKAARPAYSVLDLEKFTKATQVRPRPWDQALRDYIYLDLEGEL